jgi:RNA polymerase sigma factor (sigma-70 family)
MTREVRSPAGQVSTSEPETLFELVHQARSGDKGAWSALIGRLKGLVWRATADGGLSLADREDVFAVTFFRLFEHLEDIREPQKLPGWVATTARNEVRQILRRKRRTEPRSEIERWENIDIMGVDEGLLDGELRRALQAAFLRLGCPCQQLLRLVSAVPPLSYDQVSQLMGVPRGAVGPTRQRCLERLRRSPELRPFLAGGRS